MVTLNGSGQHKDAMLAHRAPEPNIRLRIILQKVGKGFNRPSEEVGDKDRPEAGDLHFDAQFVGNTLNAISGALGKAKAMLVDAAVFKHCNSCQRGGDANGMAVVGSCEEYATPWAKAV